MRTVNELKMPRAIEKTIRVNLERIKLIRDSLLPGGINYDVDRVQSSNMNDRYAAAMARIYDIEKRIDRLQKKRAWYIDERIPYLLKLVKNPDARKVIELHDVFGLPMVQVENILFVSHATAYRLRAQGLAEMENDTNDTYNV